MEDGEASVRFLDSNGHQYSLSMEEGSVVGDSSIDASLGV